MNMHRALADRARPLRALPFVPETSWFCYLIGVLSRGRSTELAAAAQDVMIWCEGCLSMPQHKADENLLFGILALQMDFITANALIEAMNAWLLRKHIPLSEILEERGALSGARSDTARAPRTQAHRTARWQRGTEPGLHHHGGMDEGTTGTGSEKRAGPPAVSGPLRARQTCATGRAKTRTRPVPIKSGPAQPAVGSEFSGFTTAAAWAKCLWPRTSS